ncbi:MAG: patatin-like phospholipase family protein [Candidatus Omnitrophota bacterium]
MKKVFKVALALGGGGVRGFAHIGAMKVLKSHSVPLDLVVGTSIGAIIGGCFCLNPDTDILEQRFLEMINRPQVRNLELFFAQVSDGSDKKFIIERLISRIRDICAWNLKKAKKWLVRTEPIVALLSDLFGEKKFSETQIPFACVAVDLIKGTEIIIREGRILDGILASSSIPGIFAPLKCDEGLLVDGGILASIPAREARILGADFVIGVDLEDIRFKKELYTGLDVMFQSDLIKTHFLNEINLKYCDWVIKPDITDISWSEFSRGPFCLRQGESAALKEVDKIKNALNKKRRFYSLKKLFSRPKGGSYVD